MQSQVCMPDAFARVHSAYTDTRPSTRATIGYNIYKSQVSNIDIASTTTNIIKNVNIMGRIIVVATAISHDTSKNRYV